MLGCNWLRRTLDRLHDQPCHFFPVATYELYGGCTGDLRAMSPTFNSSSIQFQREEVLCIVSTPADVDVKDSCIAVEIPWLVWLPAIGIFEQSRIDMHSVELSRNWHPSKRQHYQVYLRKFSETDFLTWWRAFFAVASGSKLRLLLSYRLLWISSVENSNRCDLGGRKRSVRLNTRCHLLAFAAKVEKQLQATVSIQWAIE